MKILVSGGAGFIGSHLVETLIKSGHKVAVVDDLSTGRRENLNTGAEFYQIAVQSAEMSNIFAKEKPAVVFHLAAQVNVRRSIADPLSDAEANISGSLNVFENSVRYGVRKIIFISSGGAIYGDGVTLPTGEEAKEEPISPYGVAKLSAERYLYYYHKQYNLRYTVLRLANVYGPRQNYLGEAGVVSVFCHNLKNNLPLTVNGGAQTRDFVFVTDVVAACLAAARKNFNGTCNVGTGKETDIWRLAKAIKKISRSKTAIVRHPYIKGEQRRSCLDARRARRVFGWKDKWDLEAGLAATWNWFKEN